MSLDAIFFEIKSNFRTLIIEISTAWKLSLKVYLFFLEWLVYCLDVELKSRIQFLKEFLTIDV